MIDEPEAGHGRDEWTASNRRRLFGLVVGLLFLAYPGTHLAREQSGLTELAGWVLLAVFGACFVWALRQRPVWTGAVTRGLFVPLGVMVAQALVLPFVFGGEWTALMVFVAMVCAVRITGPASAIGIVTAAAAVFGQSLLLGDDPQGAALTAVTTGSVAWLMREFVRSRRLVAELRDAHGEVGRLAAANERLRIARDLHDLLGHSLSLIVLKSELARRVAGTDPAAAAREIGDVEGVARQALGEMRDAVSGYRRLGLAVELDSAREALRAAGVTATILTSGTPLPEAADGLLGWAVREGVTNVVRHARARGCEIRVAREETEATLEILDDGPGPYGTTAGNGLTGLTERVNAEGGTVTAEPRGTDPGFRLAVRVPVAAMRPAS